MRVCKLKPNTRALWITELLRHNEVYVEQSLD